MDTNIKKNIIILHKKKIFLILPFFLIFPVLYLYYTRELVIFPGPVCRGFQAYSDSSVSDFNNGNSIINDLTIYPDSVTFSYTLQNQYQFPYAGFIMKLTDTGKFLNMAAYDYLDLVLDPGTATVLEVMLLTFVDGFTDTAVSITRRYVCKEIDLVPGEKRYRYHLKEFTTPYWWYDLNHTSETKLGTAGLTKVMDMKLESGELTPINKPQTFTLYSMILKKDNRSEYIAFFLIFIGYFLAYWLILVLAKRSAAPLIIPYEKLSVENYADEDLRKIVASIAKQYTDEELTVTKISRDIGLGTAKISSLLQQGFNCTFKQYLNSIRLAEAGRIIKETDRQISDIAYKVGYKSVTHFNRIFKQIYSMSPNEYRKQNDS